MPIKMTLKLFSNILTTSNNNHIFQPIDVYPGAHKSTKKYETKITKGVRIISSNKVL